MFCRFVVASNVCLLILTVVIFCVLLVMHCVLLVMHSHKLLKMDILMPETC